MLDRCALKTSHHIVEFDATNWQVVAALDVADDTQLVRNCLIHTFACQPFHTLQSAMCLVNLNHMARERAKMCLPVPEIPITRSNKCRCLDRSPELPIHLDGKDLPFQAQVCVHRSLVEVVLHQRELFRVPLVDMVPHDPPHDVNHRCTLRFANAWLALQASFEDADQLSLIPAVRRLQPI